MFKPDKRLQKFYVKCNKLFFDNALPSDVQVGWLDFPPDDEAIGTTATLDEENGVVHHTIYIDEAIRPLVTVVKLTILHEMCHIKLHPYNYCGKKSKKFNDEMLRLAARGAFNGLW